MRNPRTDVAVRGVRPIRADRPRGASERHMSAAASRATVFTPGANGQRLAERHQVL
jgi:hypothetical protein